PEPPLTLNPPNDDEARRLAELERQRKEEEERRKWERLRAPQVISDNAAATAGSVNPDSNGSSNATQPDDDPNRRFLASVSAAGVDTARATKNPRI
ncbi:hypothetical protein ABTD04_20445, partial [Acinetobacter baumannii]